MTLCELMATGRYDTDKRVGYLEHYEGHCAPFRDEPFAFMEIGVKDGASLRLWHAYFSRARIFGLDVTLPVGLDLPRCQLLQGNEADAAAMAHIGAAHGPFRVVIDDASHVARKASIAFDVLFPFVEPGGFYVIEDWGTAYSPGFLDGQACEFTRNHDGRRFRNHPFGMAGWLKQLMDDCGTVAGALPSSVGRPPGPRFC